MTMLTVDDLNLEHQLTSMLYSSNERTIEIGINDGDFVRLISDGDNSVEVELLVGEQFPVNDPPFEKYEELETALNEHSKSMTDFARSRTYYTLTISK